MIIVGSFLPEPFGWSAPPSLLGCAGAGVVMESITVRRALSGTARVPRVGECADKQYAWPLFIRDKSACARSARADLCGGAISDGRPYRDLIDPRKGRKTLAVYNACSFPAE